MKNNTETKIWNALFISGCRGTMGTKRNPTALRGSANCFVTSSETVRNCVNMP